MKSKSLFKSRFFLLIFLGITGFIVALAAIINMNSDIRKLEKLKLSTSLSEKIRYYDEVLTTSARMATLQDTQIWKKRYYDNVKKLDDVIVKISQLNPALKGKFDELNEINLKLVKLEEQALNFASDGDFELSKMQVFSTEYEVLKKLYKSSLDEALVLLNDYDIQLEKKIHSSVVISSNIVLFSIILVIFSTYLIFRQLIHQNKKFNLILDSQSTLLVVANRFKIRRLNKSALDFLGYANFQSFLNDNVSFSDFFVEEKGFLSKYKNGESWLDVIFKDNKQKHYVKIQNLHGVERIFKVDVSHEKVYDNSYVITFTDITKLTQLQKNLENEVQKQVENVRKKDLVLVQQSKMASLGEMLENIAHQWRQPLSVIGTAVSAIKFRKDFDQMDDNFLDKTLDNISNSTEHLSQTIDVFRDFYISDDNKEFDLSHMFNKARTLLSSKFKNKDIEFILDVEEININAKENELIQVVMNIFSNAIDELSKIDDEKRVLKVTTYVDKKSVAINILDNAGGVPYNLIDKVFQHRFTTKSSKDGTGIGLYMSKLIIEKANGSIKVENKKFKHENKTYKGANFIITLPLV